MLEDLGVVGVSTNSGKPIHKVRCLSCGEVYQRVAHPSDLKATISCSPCAKRRPRPRSAEDKFGNSKLTQGKVDQIRLRLATGELPVRIAPDFGVTRECVSLIKRGVTWKAVLAAPSASPEGSTDG